MTMPDMMRSAAENASRPLPCKPNCLSLDLEVGLRRGRIRQIAAMRGDSGESLCLEGGKLAGTLRRLDALADGCSFVFGDNLIDFDRPPLAAADLRLLALPVIDTLWLNPLAFPRHP